MISEISKLTRDSVYTHKSSMNTNKIIRITNYICFFLMLNFEKLTK